MPRRLTTYTRACLGVLVAVCAMAVGHAPLRAQGGLTSIAPAGATGGVTIQITGVGFAPSASDNAVIFTPATGPQVTVAGTSIVVVNATTDTRRLAVVVPEGLAAGTAAVQVRNTLTGTVAGGRMLEVIALSIPEPVTVVRGSDGVIVPVRGSPNAQLGGRTTVTAGAGVTVSKVTVVSPTELSLTVNVAATAEVGPRTLVVTASSQTGRVPVGFSVVDMAPPPATLDAISVLPASLIFTEVGTGALAVTGHYSDGSTQNLTASTTGTTYQSSNADVATVDAGGVVTAVANGTATITATNGGNTATASVLVAVNDTEPGDGFIRGEAYDDRRGLPLPNVVVFSREAGASAPTPVATADDRGRFVVAAPSGPALVRVARDGYTSVDRPVDVPAGAVITALDARLTPLDGRLNPLTSVFGGVATSTDGSASLSIAPGGLPSDALLRLTPLSGQGLPGLLPAGWSPVATVDIAPSGVSLGVPASLRLLHVDTLTPGTSVTLVAYDTTTRTWVVRSPGTVTADGRAITADVDVTGAYAFVIADEQPVAPPTPVEGESLAGVARDAVPVGSTADGLVVPRSAPPGDDARAVGTVVLTPASPLSSGAVLRARVTEQFDLLDTSRVQPQGFIQDLVIYQRPLPAGATAGRLAARLPITPSIQFTIQQLSLGTVRLDITTDEAGATNGIVGAGGGTVTDAAGTALTLPSGALAADAAIGLLPLDANSLSVPLPTGYTLLGAVLVDAVGLAFTQPAPLSIVRPSGVDDAALVLVAQVITDATGGRRLRLVGIGVVSATRIAVGTTVGSLTFDGVRGGGEFLFLRPAQPHGFLTGLVTGTGATPQALALVSADTAPFVTLTGPTGVYAVAGRVGVPTTIAAVQPTGAAAAATRTLAVLNEVVTMNLALTHAAPAVTSTIPTTGAVNVALDASIVVDFSKAMDAASVTSSSVVLAASGVPVATQAVLSANQRRLTITPASPLAGLMPYTLTLTSALRDTAGNALVAFTPLTFTTLDPSKATPLAVGTITADLPDDDGLARITGAPGAAEPGSAVVVTNLRTQHTTTVLASADGSFVVRLPIAIGDEVALTLRDAGGRETTIAITQFGAAGGPTSVGESGGTIAGAGGRNGRILKRALETAGVFEIGEAGNAAAPGLPSGFTQSDRFTLTVDGASFRRLESLTLTESQGRFQPATTFSAPFIASGQLTVPADFLVSASVRFTAAATDRSGARRTATGTTVVVAATPDVSARETGSATEFPTLFVTAPAQATPSQVVGASAIAPAARVDFDLPAAPGPLPTGHSVVLGRLVDIAGEPKLSATDRLALVDVDSVARLLTVGRELPGASRTGEYLAVKGPFAFVSGRVNGPASIVTADESPFVYETDGANGAFVLPVPAGQPFTLRFLDAATGALLGTTSGQAPGAELTTDVGQPMAPTGGTLTVTARPDAQSIVEIDAPITFTFSEPLDRGSVSPGAFIVTDPAGARVYGHVVLADDDRSVTFVPLRRWKFGTTYRFGVGTSVTAASGARLASSSTGVFTTFAPRIVGGAPTGVTHDVATAGNLAVAATATGATVLDVARPGTPTTRATMPMSGGARGVALVDTPLTNRTGQQTPAPVAVIASGDASSPGLLRSFSLSVPASPALLGATQIAAPSGQTPPVGVPAGSGVPNAVAIDETGTAIVSIRGAGARAVAIGAAVPLDTVNVARGIGARFPIGGSRDVRQAAVIGGRIAVAGPAGLDIIDRTTFAPVTSEALADGLDAVATLPAFGVDMNGDRHIDPIAEIFDVIVGGDKVGNVQVYRLDAVGQPELISVIRLPASTPVGGVSVDASERLAYVGAGVRGLALIDLAGQPSVQPIDLDHDGQDDRILGFVDTPGAAGRSALAIGRGLGYIADGAAGVAIAQLTPARVRVETLRRDPIRSIQGDEQSILTSRTAFTTDEAIALRLVAALPPDTELFLDLPGPSGSAAPVLVLGDGTTTRALTSGVNAFELLVSPDVPAGARIPIRVVTSSGVTVTAVDVTFVAPGVVLTSAPIRSLAVSPTTMVLTAAQPTARLSVAATYFDGRTLNVAASTFGTTYASSDTRVVQVSLDGEVTAAAGGSATIVVSYGGHAAQVQVVVDAAAVLTDLRTDAPYATLTRPGESVVAQISGRMSDGRIVSSAARLGLQWVSSDTAVATVDADGRISAVGEGLATITAPAGTFSATIRVAVEFRTPAVLTGFDVQPFIEVAGTDTQQADARAQVTGTGSLEGLDVTFGLPDGRTFTGTTDRSGVAIARLFNLRTPGTFIVTGSVVNPASGNTLTDSETLTVQVRGSDAEPNDTAATAIPVALATPVSGRVGGSDVRDAFRLTPTASGTLVVRLSLSPATDPGAVRVVVLSPDGTEIARQTPVSRDARLRQPVGYGPVVVAIESTGPDVEYTLTNRVEQTPIALTSVSPASGGTGTLVRIGGTGFSTSATQTTVLFGGALGRVESVSPTAIDVRVPSTAVDGPLTVISGTHRAAWPSFTVGRTGALPEPTLGVTTNPDAVRFDPISGQIFDVTKILVSLDPVATRAQLETIIAPLGASIVAEVPMANQYLVELPGAPTLAAFETARQTLAVSGAVRDAGPNTIRVFEQPMDSRDAAGNWASTWVSRGLALAHARVFEALTAIRNTPPFDDAANLRPAKVAVIDSGFDPKLVSEFLGPDGVSIVELWRPDPVTKTFTNATATPNDADGHGTEVTSIIAAVNDGAGMNGVLNGLFQPGEQPLTVRVYQHVLGGTIDETVISAAVAHIAAAGDFDAVNMSFGADYGSPSASFLADRSNQITLLGALGGRTVVATSAGNKGVLASLHTPSVVSLDLPHVMSVGATGVANADGTGEGKDQRARFGGQVTVGIPCPDDMPPVTGSNCGVGVTVAAPGEDMLVATTATQSSTGYLPPHAARGTSFATPMVTALAALLQAIRPDAAPLTADALVNLIVDSGDDISATWGSGPMRRINALNAVRAVLPPSASQAVYVADHDAINDDGTVGRVVAIEIDPLTGQRRLPADHKVIPLRLTRGAATYTFQNPTSTAVSPGGESAWVVVKSTNPTLGDGVLEIGTATREVRTFIPFSGASLGGGPTASNPPPVPAGSNRSGLAFSRDGRLLYAATGLRITIINTVERKVVWSMADLPDPYTTRASEFPTALAARLADVAAVAAQGVAGRPGAVITALDVSPDGRRLYAALSTGSGGGHQPGGAFAIDIDLYRDSDDGQHGLQTALDTFFTVVSPPTPMLDAGGFMGGDEPSDIAVTDGPGGSFVYLVNGGLNYFESIPASNFNTSSLLDLMIGAAFGQAGGNNFTALVANMHGLPTTNEILYGELAADLREQARTGLTLLSAPGFTGAFAVDPATGVLGHAWSFPSDVVFGWNPPSGNGGRLVTQYRFPTVFAKRPSSIAIHPDGRRAIVSLFQTGNFAVLDLGTQARFANPPGGTPNAAFAGLPAGMFQAVAAVTPALRLDNHLWPRRGALGGSLDRLVQSPDEALLYPWHVEYAQNGRFAVGTHTGVGRPQQVTVPLPDWTTLPPAQALIPLTALGFNVTTGSTTGLDPNGQSVTVGQSYTFRRGGGGVSIVDDERIANDLTLRSGLPTHTADGERPWFATNPLCTGTENAGGNLPTCQQDVVTHWLDYTPAGATEPVQFNRPRGVTIQPFVYFETPRFGDHITRSDAIFVGWRDARVQVLLFQVYDLGDAASPTEPVDVSGGVRLVGLTPEAMASRVQPIPFLDLFGEGHAPAEDRRYRVEVRAMATSPDNVELSKTHIVVTLNESGATVPPSTLELDPTALFFVEVPHATGKQLKVTLHESDGSTRDVSADPETRYEWLNNPIPSNEIFDGILDFAKDKLEKAGVSLPEVPFAWAEIAVSATGLVTVMEPGLQFVWATHPDSTRPTFPTLIFAGLKLDSISLTPESIITTSSRGIIEAIVSAQRKAKALRTGEDIDDVDVNAPLILTTDELDPLYTTSRGYVRLVDMEFEYLGKGKLAVSDLVALLARIRGMLGTPETPQEKVLKTAAGLVVSVAATEALVDFDIANFAIADFCSIPLEGCVKGLVPGVTNIIGTVDLDNVHVGPLTFDLGLGEASDSVVTWVLPQIESARLEPVITTLRRGSLAQKAVRTFVTFDLADSGFIQIAKDKVQKRVERVIGDYTDLESVPLATEELAELIMPDGLPIFDVFNAACDEPRTIDTDSGFRLELQGCFEDDSDDDHYRLTARKLRLGLHWPTALSHYTIDDPSLVDLDVHSNAFAALVRARNRIGDTPIRNQRDFLVFGEIDAPGRVRVRDYTQPYTTKSLQGNPTSVEPGQTLRYVITFGNPTATELANVRLTDTLTFRAYLPDGSLGAAQILSVETYELGKVGPYEGRQIASEITAPLDAGELSNTVTSNAGGGSGGSGGGGSGGGGGTPETNDVAVEVKPKLEVSKKLISAAQTSTAPGAPDQILAGTTAKYRVTVKNKGQFPARGVFLTDAAFAGSDATGIDTRFFSHGGVPTLPAGGSMSVEVHIPIPKSDAGRQLVNNAHVNIPDTEDAETRHDIIGADVVIAKDVVTPSGGVLATLVRGSVVDYAVTVSNIGTAESAPIVVEDYAAIAGDIVFPTTPFTVGPLAAETSQVIPVQFTVPHLSEAITPCPTVCVGGTSSLTNFAQVLLNGMPGVVATTTNDVVNPRLTITPSLVQPALAQGQPVPDGSQVDYDVVVENTDSHIAAGAVLTVRIRIGATTLLEQTLALGDLAPGAQASRQVSVQLPAGRSGQSLRLETSVNFEYLDVPLVHVVQ